MAPQGPQFHTVLVQSLNKGRAGSAHKPRLHPVFKNSLSRQQTALGEAATLSPTAGTQEPELNPAFQCHLWGAAHPSASCTVPGEPGSSSVPTSHSAALPVPSSHHSTAGRERLCKKHTRHCWAWQPDVYLSCQSTLCPPRRPNPNVGRTPRGCQKLQEALNVPGLQWPARDSTSSTVLPETRAGYGIREATTAPGETGNVCRK